MRGYIQRTTAWRNRLYQEVLQECGTRVTARGYFRKDAVIQHLGYVGMEEALNWGFIIDWLSDTKGVYGVMTVPVAERFFKDRVYERATDSDGRPTAGPIAIGRYVASGNGKKTVGFVRANYQGGEFLLWRAQNMEAQLNGKTNAIRAVVRRAANDPAIPPAVQNLLPIV